mmetsp:Transcript_65740/g.189541  ORF Transcript_65740/g.189541 Transcript_65740/m.189541 type:complete len:224 (-) Transcript_65740:866-1537(-)
MASSISTAFRSRPHSGHSDFTSETYNGKSAIRTCVYPADASEATELVSSECLASPCILVISSFDTLAFASALTSAIAKDASHDKETSTFGSAPVDKASRTIFARFCASSCSSLLFFAFLVSYSISFKRGPSTPRIPASSKASRIALSSIASSFSQPPFGKIHSDFRLAETNRIFPPSTIGTQPVTIRKMRPDGSWAQRWLKRPFLDVFCDVTFMLIASDCRFS